MPSNTYVLNCYEKFLRFSKDEAEQFATMRYLKGEPPTTVILTDNPKGGLMAKQVEVAPRCQISIRTQRLMRVVDGKIEVQAHQNGRSQVRWLKLVLVWNKDHTALQGLLDEDGNTIRFSNMSRAESVRLAG
jgi:hypothetical protein